MTEDREGFSDTVPVRRGEVKPSRQPGETSENHAGRREVLQPGHVTGVGRGVPLVYGARAVSESVDGAGSEIGAPPLDPQTFEAANQAALAISREAQPSFEKRETRARKQTLVVFALVILVSALGLGVIVTLVFG